MTAARRAKPRAEARASRRRRVRSCQDCKTPLSLGASDKYCRSCLPAHLRRCHDCWTPFTRDETNTRCPSCRGQLALFGVQS